MKKFIEELYINNRAAYNFFDDIDSLDDNERDCYVYAWFTKTNNKKFFYIGKGKRDRYRHIIWDINALELNKRKYKGKRYKILQENLGIDYEFLYESLTAKEAAILEVKCILDYVKCGHPLLNQIIPWHMFETDEETERRWNEWEDKVYEADMEKFLDYFRH